MALNSTLYRFEIKVSDVDRGLYETLSLRVPLHPSESLPFFLTRIIAYALNYQEGIEFSQGIATPDAPALFVKDLTGRIKIWIDIGNPSARRLHKASKAAAEVRVYTHRDPALLSQDVAGAEVHRIEAIEVFCLEQKFLSRLAEILDRENRWELLHTEGELSISTVKESVQGEIRTYKMTGA